MRGDVGIAPYEGIYKQSVIYNLKLATVTFSIYLPHFCFLC